jgi:hypothetical protein
MLCKRLQRRGCKVSTDPAEQFRSSQPAGGLDDRALTVPPARLQRVQPGAFHRPAARQPLHAPVRLGRVMVLAHPRADRATAMPGRVVPHQAQDARGLGGQLRREPAAAGGGDMAPRASRDKAPSCVRLVGAHHAIAAPSLGSGVACGHGWLDTPQRALLRPGVERRVGQPAPPRLLSTPQPPGRMRRGQRHSPVAPRFFRA